MLFYPTRRTNMPSTRRGASRPFTTDEPTEVLHVTWMLKSFAMGVTLLGLSYWLVQLAGFQYLASLTSVTLLAFLLAYVVWCVLHRNKVARQVQDLSTTDSSIDFMSRYFQRVIF
jgi:Flp pilus assembly protein TadB